MNSANPLASFLYWIGGTAEDLVTKCEPWVQRLYMTLGMVFACNLLFLCWAWIKVFTNYFGVFGVLPGLIVPAVFVLGIDRLIAMRPRPLTGALQRYDLDFGRSIWEIVIRLVISAALSLMSTFTLQLSLCQDLIREQAKAEAKQANAGLRQEYVDSIKSLSGPEFDLLKGQENTLLQQRLHAQKELEHALAEETNAKSAARAARQEQFAEAGGLDSQGRQRTVGIGPRYRAQRDIADMNDSLATAARETRERTEARIEALERELLVVREGISDGQREHNQRLDAVNESIKSDIRYVVEKGDLFSDAVFFLRLFSDPQRGAGVLLMAGGLFILLVTLELAAILALYLLPETQYDVLKGATIVRQSARKGSISGMEDIMEEMVTYERFTPGESSQEFAKVVQQQAEKMLRARIEELNDQLRSKQAKNLSTLDVRLPRLGTVQVQPSANSDMAAPDQAGNDDKTGVA